MRVALYHYHFRFLYEKNVFFFEKGFRWRTYTNETFGARKWLPNDPQIMRAAMDEEYFRFFHEKNVVCSFCKDLHTTLGFGALKWPPLAALLCDIFAACAKEPRRYALECFSYKKFVFCERICSFSLF